MSAGGGPAQFDSPVDADTLRREALRRGTVVRGDPIEDANFHTFHRFDQRRGWTSYQYDPVGQLLARAPEQARAEVFRYDPAGNTHEGGPGATSREYGPGNRLVRKGNTHYRWDAEGRLCEKWVDDPETGARRAWSYTWSVAGLLESVTTPEGERVELRDDPFGRRLEKRVGKAPASSLQAFRPRAVTRLGWSAASILLPTFGVRCAGSIPWASPTPAFPSG